LGVPVAKLTEMMISKYYSASDQEELKKFPSKIQALDYIYSRSFDVLDKTYEPGQFEKIDVRQYDLTRKADTDVEVLDKASGLLLKLYSLNRMERDKSLILNNKTRDPAGKIAD
jgi:hypothetical protein